MVPYIAMNQGGVVSQRVPSQLRTASVVLAPSCSYWTAAGSARHLSTSRIVRFLGSSHHRCTSPMPVPIAGRGGRMLGVTKSEYGGGGRGGYGGGSGGYSGGEDASASGPPGGGSLPWARSLLAICCYLLVLLLVRLVYAVYKEAEELEEEVNALYFLYSLATAVAALWPWARRRCRGKGDPFCLDWDQPQMPEVDLSTAWNQMRDGCERVWVSAKALALDAGTVIRAEASKVRERLPWVEGGGGADVKEMARDGKVQPADRCDSKGKDEGGVKGVVAVGGLFLLGVVGLKVLCEEEDRRLDGGEGGKQKGKGAAGQAAAPPVACDQGPKK